MPRRAEVDAWFARYENPMKPVVLRMREIVLGADARIDECIKWQAPTFTFEGNLASFFPKSKAHASLMFHEGARIPGKHPRLEGGGETGRFIKIGSVADADAARADLEAVVRAWCDWRASGKPRARLGKPESAKPTGKRPASKKAGAKTAKRAAKPAASKTSKARGR